MIYITRFNMQATYMQGHACDTPNKIDKTCMWRMDCSMHAKRKHPKSLHVT